MAVVSMKALLETGVHFGHRTRRWNPKMKPYIFTERNGIHIIDLQQTLGMIEDAYNIIRDTVTEGGSVLFVGTKRQAQDTIATEAARARQPYVNERWLGGTLTNWQTIRQRIDYLKRLESRRDEGDFDSLKKRERLRVEREIEKLNMRLGGIRDMKGLPDLLFIVDINHEETAVREANILGIPVLALVDTNCNPDPVDFLIPSNDDAIRAIKLIVGKMADAAIEGSAVRQESVDEEVTDVGSYGSGFDGMEDEDDEVLLGESTLAKLREAVSDEGEADEEEAGEEEAVAEATDDAAPAEEEDNEEETAEADTAVDEA